MADTALGFVVQIRFPACSFRGSPQERTGLTIRSSRCHFTAAIFFGMFVLVCGRAVARLNSGVRHGTKHAYDSRVSSSRRSGATGGIARKVRATFQTRIEIPGCPRDSILLWLGRRSPPLGYARRHIWKNSARKASCA